jgi:hypothetical protein
VPRLTADQWDDIRSEWEADPITTFSGLGEKFGVDKANICRKAARDGWSKIGQIGSINENAQRRADARADGNATQRNGRDVATRCESESIRADVLVRHRHEWDELMTYRRLALEAMNAAGETGDRVAWSVAKLAADTAKANLQALEIAQAGEARAWGLDYQRDNAETGTIRSITRRLVSP